MANPRNMERPIFIFGQARAGTTLVQRMLNQSPNVLIYGEHVGFLKGIAQSYYGLFHHPSILGCPDNNYFRAREAAELRDAAKFEAATHSSLTCEGVTEAFRVVVRSLVNSHNFQGRWGFKEIHYGIDDQLCPFLNESYPAAKFIFMVRNPLDQISSKMRRGWWPRDSLERSIEIWNAQATSFEKWASLMPDVCRMIRYEDFSTTRQLVANLLSWLDLECTDRHLNVVFDLPHIGATPHGPALPAEQRRLIRNRCDGSRIYKDSQIPERQQS